MKQRNAFRDPQPGLHAHKKKETASHTLPQKKVKASHTPSEFIHHGSATPPRGVPKDRESPGTKASVGNSTELDRGKCCKQVLRSNILGNSGTDVSLSIPPPDLLVRLPSPVPEGAPFLAQVEAIPQAPQQTACQKREEKHAARSYNGLTCRYGNLQRGASIVHKFMVYLTFFATLCLGEMNLHLVVHCTS